MGILKSMINNHPIYRAGYDHAIKDLKQIFESAKIFNPKMNIIDLVEDWEKIISVAQNKILNKKGN